MVAIVAGSKVSTKLDVLNSLSGICDQLIVGGGIANTFLLLVTMLVNLYMKLTWLKLQNKLLLK